MGNDETEGRVQDKNKIGRPRRAAQVINISKGIIKQVAVA